MDHLRSSSGNGEDNVGIPDDLRCKRSDGKQWRCTAMSMPDKTVCEKHYIQAQRRAANSALRASLKKAKRKSLGESDIYLESKSDDYDMPIGNMKGSDYPSVSEKKYMEKVSNSHFGYSPETPPTRGTSARNSMKANDNSQRDVAEYEENLRSYKTPPHSAMESSRNRLQRSFDRSATAEYSDGSVNSSEDTGGQTCHQCRRNDRERELFGASNVIREDIVIVAFQHGEVEFVGKRPRVRSGKQKFWLLSICPRSICFYYSTSVYRKLL